MTEAEALKSLGAFPVIQAAVAIVVIGVSVWAVFRGSREKKPVNGNGTPSWTLYGPVHDAMGAVHEMNEQSRETNRILGRIEVLWREHTKEQREQTMLLEDIRNNQVARGDIIHTPPQGSRRKPV
jgi:hypothetical protein